MTSVRMVNFRHRRKLKGERKEVEGIFGEDPDYVPGCCGCVLVFAGETGLLVFVVTPYPTLSSISGFAGSVSLQRMYVIGCARQASMECLCCATVVVERCWVGGCVCEAYIRS